MLSYTASGQNHITMAKYRSHKTLKIMLGQTIKVKQLKEDTAFKGDLFAISDSMIVLNKDTILDSIYLQDIEWIKHKPGSFGTQFTQGSAQSIAAAGPVYVILGIVNNAIVGVDPVFQERNAKVGGILLLSGLALYGVVELFSNKRRSTKAWKIIVTDFSNL